MREQFKLLGLYAFGLACGALGLLVLRDILIKLLLREASPEATAMVWRLALTMVFVGLLQALAMWALGSRWLKSSLLYGALGLSYWVILLCLGKTPEQLLRVMPVIAGVAFAILFVSWFVSMKRSDSVEAVR